MGRQVKHTQLFDNTIDLLFASVPLHYSEGTILNLLSAIGKYKSILIDNPYLGQIEPGLEFVYDFRRIVIKPYFKLIYSVSDEYIVFHDIWDSRRNPSILMNNLVWNL